MESLSSWQGLVIELASLSSWQGLAIQLASLSSWQGLVISLQLFSLIWEIGVWEIGENASYQFSFKCLTSWPPFSFVASFPFRALLSLALISRWNLQWVFLLDFLDLSATVGSLVFRSQSGVIYTRLPWSDVQVESFSSTTLHHLGSSKFHLLCDKLDHRRASTRLFSLPLTSHSQPLSFFSGRFWLFWMCLFAQL